MNTIAEHGSKILLALQNAYDKGSLAKGWNPRRWRSEFDSSRTGRRLWPLLGDGSSSVRITNVAGSRLGKGSASVLQPSMSHVRKTLKRISPLVVIACGKLPEQAMSEAWSGSLIAVPHPAYKLLTNELMEAAGLLLTNWLICSQLYPAWAEDTAWTTSEKIGYKVTPKQLRGEELLRLAFRQRKGKYEVEPVDCAADCDRPGSFRGPVCPTCLCCRGCAGAYEYANGKKCPECKR